VLNRGEGSNVNVKPTGGSHFIRFAFYRLIPRHLPEYVLQNSVFAELTVIIPLPQAGQRLNTMAHPSNQAVRQHPLQPLVVFHQGPEQIHNNHSTITFETDQQ
jgi:hypothetical protein